MAFGKAKQGFCEVTYGSPEYVAWRAYFIGLHWIPVTFKAMGNGSSWTAPIRWPHELDITLPDDYPRSSYEVVRAISEPKSTRVYSDQERVQNIMELRRRFGQNFGIGNRPRKNEQLIAEWKLKRMQHMAGHVPVDLPAAQEAAE